jgi:hypothetical protein
MGAPTCPAPTVWNGRACVRAPAGPVPSDPPPELTRIDDTIRTTFLQKPYVGKEEDILAQYQRDAREAAKHDADLQQFAATCPSRDWTAAAIAQEGMIFDSLSTKLEDAKSSLPSHFLSAPPASQLPFNSGGMPAALQAQADALRAEVRVRWRAKGDAELSAAQELAVRRYATAVEIARRYGLKGVDVDHALARLADYTRKLGEEKMRSYVTSAHVTYREGMYLRATAPSVP